ncbi:MAG: hypothetical protein DRQ48_00275 [Gammaproteobacteria bacterium]|nr:MAG: hypothetical protein DRQ48_00275 [Gammaproteobacteria bacterium]
MNALRINAIVSWDYEGGTWNVTDKREEYNGDTLYQITRKGDGQVRYWIRRKDLNTRTEKYFTAARDQRPPVERTARQIASGGSLLKGGK